MPRRPFRITRVGDAWTGPPPGATTLAAEGLSSFWCSSAGDGLVQTAGCDQFVKHPVECTQPDGQMALSVFKVSRDSGKP
jgi:hypothetical protein